MQNQEPGNNLFCIYRDCEDLALFGDYCKAHQFQRAEAAEARAAALEDTLQKQLAIRDDLVIRVNELEAERDELARKLEQAQNALSLVDVVDFDALCNWIVGAQSELASLADDPGGYPEARHQEPMV